MSPFKCFIIKAVTDKKLEENEYYVSIIFSMIGKIDLAYHVIRSHYDEKSYCKFVENNLLPWIYENWVSETEISPKYVIKIQTTKKDSRNLLEN